jgi:hypothetical protein
LPLLRTWRMRTDGAADFAPSVPVSSDAEHSA